MPRHTAQYRGRFAPSPTGALHLGSLIAALASYLDARSHHGKWLLRMEDLDPPREEPGAARAILNSLQQHGLNWDEPVLWQSQNHARYSALLDTLQQQGHLFNCDCTRALLGPNGACRGRCQGRTHPTETSVATRVTVPQNHSVAFNDQLQGVQNCQLGEELADFVLKRKDGLYAYQLAVVADDAAQGITHVVRGCDLIDSTARQIYLQQLLGYRIPHYCHLPVITNAHGQKFSKQNHAPALDHSQAAQNLRKALRFLQQAEPPKELESPAQILECATAHWNLHNIPATAAITASAEAYR